MFGLGSDHTSSAFQLYHWDLEDIRSRWENGTIVGNYLAFQLKATSALVEARLAFDPAWRS